MSFCAQQKQDTSLIPDSREGSPSGTALFRSGALATALLLTLTSCGQMGGLYQPEPEAPQSRQSAPQSSPGKANAPTGQGG
ncbi:LPS translocon maturation chaperone LptM [Congregibacter brevis]|uniref:LPS translocon maturation chaperone LptM n=1 Tax=Congregibacter brevis TaxID=3081201 RepID=UPI00388F5565